MYFFSFVYEWQLIEKLILKLDIWLLALYTLRKKNVFLSTLLNVSYQVYIMKLLPFCLLIFLLLISFSFSSWNLNNIIGFFKIIIRYNDFSRCEQNIIFICNYIFFRAAVISTFDSTPEFAWLSQFQLKKAF